MYLADTSAWHRSGATASIAERWESLLAADDLALCSPIRLEVLYSARGPDDYSTVRTYLETIPDLALDRRASTAALRAQARLVRSGKHSGPRTTDLLIAAVAEVNDAVLLHYNRHFDLIAGATGQPAEWLARRGSLD